MSLLPCKRCGQGDLIFIKNAGYYTTDKSMHVHFKKTAAVYACDFCGKVTFKFFNKEEQILMDRRKKKNRRG